MKCPYAVNRIVQTKTEINYDAESKEDGSVVTTINKAEFTDFLINAERIIVRQAGVNTKRNYDNRNKRKKLHHR